MIGFRFNHFTKHKFKDAWNNFKMSLRAERAFRNYKGQFRGVFPSFEYETVFEDRFGERLNLDKWRYGQAWGDFHPGNLKQYYDNDGTLSYVAPEGLVLELRNIPRNYVKSKIPAHLQRPEMPEEFTIPVGVGMVSSKQSWQYGWFEAWIKLPKGKPYWPAFWLSGVNSWPPEIDILEGYSHEGSPYAEKNIIGKLKPNRRIQPNLHYGRTDDGTKDDYGAYNIPVADCTDRFVQYACLWERDRIEIYYDGMMVYKTTDPEILKWYNKENAQQNIIINHGYHQDATEVPDESAMLIKRVKVMQAKEQV